MGTHQDRLLHEDEVVELTGMSKFTLQSWRRRGVEGRGPLWVNVGTTARRIVRYRESDVQAWIAELPIGKPA